MVYQDRLSAAMFHYIMKDDTLEDTANLYRVTVIALKQALSSVNHDNLDTDYDD